MGSVAVLQADGRVACEDCAGRQLPQVARVVRAIWPRLGRAQRARPKDQVWQSTEVSVNGGLRKKP
eukprot:13739589-Alexandrium_andersonii.AAC.1